jgi:hypothetical protein
MSFEDKFDDSLLHTLSQDEINSQISQLNEFGLGSEVDEAYSRMGKISKIVFPSIARDIKIARKELKKSKSLSILSSSENEATTTSTFSKYYSTTPFPLEARYNTLSQWTIPNDPAVQSVYFDISQLIVFREATLLKLKDCCNKMDETYWKYAVTRIKSKTSGKSLNNKLLVQKRIKIKLIQEEFAVAMAHLRALTIQVLEGIIKWRSKIRNVVTTKETASIYWNNINYIIKINNDCQFLNKHTTVKLWLGFTPSAFMIPPKFHNPKKVNDYRKELKYNWQEVFEKKWLEKLKTEKEEKRKRNYPTVDVFAYESDEISLKEPTPPKPEVVDILEEVVDIVITQTRKAIGKRVIYAEQGLSYNWRQKYHNYQEVYEEELFMIPFKLSILAQSNKLLAVKEERFYQTKLNEYIDQKDRWAVAAKEKILMDKEDIFVRQFLDPLMEEIYFECESRHMLLVESDRLEMKLEDFDRHYVIEGILRCQWGDYENASNDSVSALVTISPSDTPVPSMSIVSNAMVRSIPNSVPIDSIVEKKEINKEDDIIIKEIINQNNFVKEVLTSELLTVDMCEEQGEDIVSEIVKEVDFLSPNPIDINEDDNSDEFFEKLIANGKIEINEEGNIDVINCDFQDKEFSQDGFIDNINTNEEKNAIEKCDSDVNQSQNINVADIKKSVKPTVMEEWMTLRDICIKSFVRNNDGSFSDDVGAEDEDSKSFWSDLNHNPLVVEASVGYEDIFPTIYLVPPLSSDLKLRCIPLLDIIKEEEISERSLHELEQKCNFLKSHIQETVRVDYINEIEYGSRMRQSIMEFEMLRYRQQTEQLTRVPFLSSSLDQNRSLSTLSKVDFLSVDESENNSTFNDDSKIFEFTQQTSDFFHDDYLTVNNTSRIINTMPSQTMKMTNELAVDNERKLICKVNNKLQLKQDILYRTKRQGRLFNKYSIIWKNKAAFTIQQIIRSYFARKKVNIRRILYIKSKRASYIQKFIRGYLGRKRFYRLKKLIKSQSVKIRKTIIAKQKGSNVITSIVRRAAVEKAKKRQESIEENLVIKNENIGANKEKVRRMSVLLQRDKFGAVIIPKVRDMTPTGENKRTKLPPLLANDNEIEDEFDNVADDTSVLSADASLISDTSVAFIKTKVKSLLIQNVVPTIKNLDLMGKNEYDDNDTPVAPSGKDDYDYKPSVIVDIPVLKEVHGLIDDKLYSNAADIRLVPRRSAVYSPSSDIMNRHRKAQERLNNNCNDDLNSENSASFSGSENIVLRPSEIVASQTEKDKSNEKVSDSKLRILLQSPNIDGNQNNKNNYADFDSKSISSAPTSVESEGCESASLSTIGSIAPKKLMKFKPSLFLMKSYSKLVPMQKNPVPNTQSFIKPFAAKDRAFFNSSMDTKAHSLIASPNEIYQLPAGIVGNSKDKQFNTQPTLSMVLNHSQSEPNLKTDTGIDANILKTLIFR